jgi:hypothetical protein
MTISPPPAAAHGTPEAYREYVAEMLALARIYADMGATCATIGDDVGLDYAHRKLVAYVRASLSTVADLKDMRKGGHVDAT